jgi:hypothetical protein
MAEMNSEQRNVPDGTIYEIEAEFGEGSSKRLRDWYARADEIIASANLEPGPHLECMDPPQRSQLLRDQIEAKLDEERAARVEEATSRFDDFCLEYEARRAWLDLRLFDVEGADQMVASAVMATDEQLARLLDAAKRTNSLTLAKVVFGEAQRRGGLPEIVEAYFAMDPEARELLEEWHQALSPEDLERRRSSIEAMFFKPDNRRLEQGSRGAVR